MRIQGPSEIEKPEGAVAVARLGRAEEPQRTETAAATVVLSQHAARATRMSEASEKKFVDRVAELKAKVDSGTYKPDTQRLANRLVAEECIK